MALFEKVPGPVCSQTPLPPTNIGDHSQKTDAWVHLCFHGGRGFMHKISWDHAYMMALGVPLPNLPTMSRNIVYLDDQSKINFKNILKNQNGGVHVALVDTLIHQSNWGQDYMVAQYVLITGVSPILTKYLNFDGLLIFKELRFFVFFVNFNKNNKNNNNYNSEIGGSATK